MVVSPLSFCAFSFRGLVYLLQGTKSNFYICPLYIWWCHAWKNARRPSCSRSTSEATLLLSFESMPLRYAVIYIVGPVMPSTLYRDHFLRTSSFAMEKPELWKIHDQWRTCCSSDNYSSFTWPVVLIKKKRIFVHKTSIRGIWSLSNLGLVSLGNRTIYVKFVIFLLHILATKVCALLSWKMLELEFYNFNFGRCGVTNIGFWRKQCQKKPSIFLWVFFFCHFL